jgi:hypothetical protein
MPLCVLYAAILGYAVGERPALGQLLERIGGLTPAVRTTEAQAVGK